MPWGGNVGPFWLTIFSWLTLLKSEIEALYLRLLKAGASKPAAGMSDLDVKDFSVKVMFNSFSEKLNDIGEYLILLAMLILFVLAVLLIIRLPRILSRLVMVFRKRDASDIQLAGFRPQEFLAALAELLTKGLSLSDALESLSGVSSELGKRLRLAALATRNGSTLAECCSSHLSFLPKKTKRMLSIGEREGLLKEFINQNLVSADLSATINYWYAATIMFFSWLLIIIILIFVMPTFSKLYADYGGELPAMTRILIGFSNFLLKYIILLVAAFCLLAYLLRQTRFYALLLPLHYHYARLMASYTTMLLQHGKHLPDAIRVSGELTGNWAIKKGGGGVIQKMENGDAPLEAIVSEARLPREYRLFLATLLTPEGAASPHQVLLDCLTDRLNLDLSVFNQKVNYCLILGISLVVGFLVIAMYMPLFMLAETVAG